DVVAAAAAARTMPWRAPQHDLLVADRPEQWPGHDRAAVLDGSAARHRLGFLDVAGLPHAGELAAGLGGVLAVERSGSGPRQTELRLPLTADERSTYDTAWHAFLGAFDAFAAGRAPVGFAAFVQAARREPAWRPALSAWHRAIATAAWNTAKAAACAALLRRHRRQRVLLFTPDRASTYALARAHLVAPVTAELPPREREATLAAFAAGTLRMLAGPRLIDLGVPAGAADVGILVGGGFGAAQRQARLARVGAHGTVYELQALDTLEVGRAHRFAAAAADPLAAVDPDPG
ncbi:MAG: hypothetical protein KF830_17000, partial [Planctomycetes bacterium]|nr:hypothetical protein [Planctomycetota bacterium]